MKLIVLLVFYLQLKQSEEKTFSVAFLKEKKGPPPASFLHARNENIASYFY